MAFLDLRAQPMVLCMPEIEKRRYYDLQLVDLYTDNYGPWAAAPPATAQAATWSPVPTGRQRRPRASPSPSAARPSSPW
jgi:hypothetical protein